MSLNLPEMYVPASPDLVPIEAIHRNGDGFVTFHRKDGERFLDLGAVRASELRQMFPSFAHELVSDSYFSLHSYFRPGRRGAPHIPGMAPAHRKADAVRHITGVFADLDCYRSGSGMTPGQCVGLLVDAQLSGVIPPVSMLMASGRGVWACWFLVEESGELMRAWPERVALWARTTNAIGERLEALRLGFDTSARDAARICRVPGSLNPKASKRVAYWVAKDEQGQTPTYTLAAIAAAVGVPILKGSPRLAQKNRTLQARGAKGAQARWANDIRRFRLLWELRGRWPEGMRAKAVGVWSQILASLGGEEKLQPAEIESEVRALWEDCCQPPDATEPYPWESARASLRKAVQARRNRRPLRHVSIASLLEITPAESEVCGWPAAGQQQEEAGEGRAEQKATRRELLREWLSELPGAEWPSLRELAERLTEKGLPATASTVGVDLRNLGMENPRGREAHRRKRRNAQARNRRLFSD